MTDLEKYLINSIGEITTGRNFTAGVSNNVPAPKKTNPLDNLWDDEEFDVDDIIHVTQRAEVELSSQANNMTYSSFFRTSNGATSSTQAQKREENLAINTTNSSNVIPTQYQGYTEKIQADLFADFESENLNSNIPPKNPKSDSNSLTVRKDTNLPNRNNNALNINLSQRPGLSQKENLQLDHLTKAIKTLEAQIESMKKQEAKTTEKLHTKDGEVSVLRQELKKYKDSCQKLKMDKIRECENQQSKWSAEKQHFQEEVDRLRTEINFKQAEIVSLKQSGSSSSKSTELRKRLHHADLFDIAEPVVIQKFEFKVNKFIFENSAQHTPTNKKERSLLSHLINLQCQLSQVQISYKENGYIDYNLIELVCRNA